MSETAGEDMYERFDSLWAHTLSHYIQKICLTPCPCLGDGSKAPISKSDESRDDYFFWYKVLWYLDDVSFHALITSCRTFYL